MLTKSDLEQIKNYLALYGKKDSQLETVPVNLDYPEVTFEANDYLSVVQDSKNKTIKIKDLEKVFLLTFLTDEDFREALKGKIPEEMLENACVTTEKLADGAVTTIKLGDNAVTTAKIATGAITGDKIVNNTIQGSAFAANSITTDKIVDGTVTGDKLADGSIQSVDIKDNTLSGSKFIDNSISGSKIQDNVIESKHLLDNSIPASKIKDGSIESVDIKDGTLDGAKIKDNTIESVKLANNAITTDKIIDNSITAGKIANDAVTEDKIVDDSITTAKIANSSVTTDKIVDGAITEDKLANGAVTTAKLADGLISEIQNITDATPTTGSVKPVQSGGVKTAIDNVAFSTNEKINTVGIDDEPTAGSNNLVKSGSVYDIQKDLEYTNDAIDRKKSILSNGSTKSQIPTTFGTMSGGGIYKAYDYDVEGINHTIDIHSNYIVPDSGYQTAVLWALYDVSPAISGAHVIAYGPLLSTGKQYSECDLSMYPQKKILRVTFHVNTPDTEVSYYTTNFVTHDEVNDVLRTTDVINSLDSELTDKPLSAKQGKELKSKIITQETLTSTGSVKSTVPTVTGERISGGSYGALVYDVTGKSRLAYSTDATISTSYPTCVVWALYSSDTTFNSTTVVAVGDLLSAGIFSGIIDLSLYPTATTLVVTCIKATAVVTVISSVEIYATKQELKIGLDALDERIDELEADSPIVSVVLPNKIHAVKGDRIQVFYRGAIVCLNPNIYNVKVLCDVGKAYPRYLHYEASSANVGISKNLQLLVEGGNGVVKAQASAPIMTINTPSSPASNKNILVFGASVLGSGSVVNELKRRLTETSGTPGDRSNPKGLGLSNITFVGRKRGSAYDVPQEATGGWGWIDYATSGRGSACRFYVTGVSQLYIGDTYSDGTHTFTVIEINVDDGVGNILCLGASSASSASGGLTKVSGNGDDTITYSSYISETYSPFYNTQTNSIDFTTYANAFCNGSIDIMIAHCGTNDIFSATIESVATTYNNYIKPFIRKYHEQFPTGKFILSTLPLPDMNGGLGASYGAGQTANWWRGAQNYYEFARLAYELEANEEFSSYVTVANVMHLFDTENLYSYGNQPVCNRLPSVTERIGSNGVHPSGSGGSFVIGNSEAGTKTIADALYYAVCANL